jgi:iron complex transport system substrate-binding protein
VFGAKTKSQNASLCNAYKLRGGVVGLFIKSISPLSCKKAKGVFFMRRRIMKGIFKTIGLILLGAALLAGMLGGCTTTPPTLTNFTIIDSKGREVPIKDNHPQKIVSLAPSNTEILFALGLGERIVGVTDWCDYPPEAKLKPSVGSYDSPNIETIVAMEPDLILADIEQTDETYQLLENRGLTVVAIIPHNLDEVLETITLIGIITGQDKEAADLVTDMQNRIDNITEKTSQLTEAQKPRVFYIIWSDPIWTTGNGTFEDALIEIAGGKNIAHDLSGWTTINLEAVLAANPQVMIAGVGMGEGGDIPMQFIQTEPRLADTDARINGRIYSFDMNIIARPGPRIVDALEQLFQLIHPELN